MAADQPWNEAASLGVQKAGLRNLVRSLDATLRDDGVRAVTLTVNGTLERGTAFDPDRVAERDVRRGHPGRRRLAGRGALPGAGALRRQRPIR